MSTSVYTTEVQKLYVAYFARPADPAGLEFYIRALENSNGAIGSITPDFAASEESKAFYTGTATDIVTAIYQNLFGRPAETAGLAFWVKQIESGALSPAKAAFEIASAAGSTDATAIKNKVEAAQRFTNAVDTAAERAGYSGPDAAEKAREFLAGIDHTDASIANLDSLVADAVAAATGVAKPTPPGAGGSTPPAPVFSASKDGQGAITFSNAGSTVEMTWHADVFTFTSSGGTSGTATITGNSGNITSITVGASTTLKLDSDWVGSNIQFPGQGKIALTDTTMSAYYLNILDAKITPLLTAPDLVRIEADVVDVKIALEAITVGTTLQAASLNAVGLHDAVSASDLANVIFANNTTITLANSTNSLTLVDANVKAGKILTIDGSYSAGILTIDASAELDGSVVLKGGSAADSLTGGAGADTLTGGGGADALTGGLGADTLTGGAGADIFTYSATNQSTRDYLDTITDFLVNGDQDMITGITAATSNLSTILGSGAATSLSEALNAFSGANSQNNGLVVFTFEGNTYAYVETVGAQTTYNEGDFVVKLTGTSYTYDAMAAGFGLVG